jgi:hypothetical protein
MPRKVPHSPETQFQKGKTGNPNGRPKKLPDLNILLANVLGEEKDGKTAAEAILMELRAKAAKGDIRAAEVLLNRGYGLPKQNIGFTDKDGNDAPLVILQSDPASHPLKDE